MQQRLNYASNLLYNIISPHNYVGAWCTNYYHFSKAKVGLLLPDGKCLFRSLSKALFAVSSGHLIFRKLIYSNFHNIKLSNAGWTLQWFIGRTLQTNGKAWNIWNTQAEFNCKLHHHYYRFQCTFSRNLMSQQIRSRW